MIIKNLKYLRTQYKSLTQQELSDKIAVSRSRYASYESGRIEVPIDVLIRLSKFYVVTIDVMLKVDLSKVAIHQLMKLDNNRILLPLVIDKEGDDNYIELIPERASAGYLQGYGDAEYIEALDRFQLPFLKNGKFRAFQIEGDSMLPMKSGTYVVGKYIEKIDHIKEGKTYVILTHKDGATYKRVFKNDSGLILTPDNPAFEPYLVPFDEVLEIWEFASSIQIEEHQTDQTSLEHIMGMLKMINQKID